MKSFTESQKKWAMTGCLVLALGFNLSAHNAQHSGYSAELASEEPAAKTDSQDKEPATAHGKITTANGIVKVTYVEKGDKVQAVVTEGNICAECNNSVELNTKFTDDIEALNVALLKSVESKKEEKAKAPKKVVAISTTSKNEEDEAEEGPSEEESFTEKVLAKIEKICTKRAKNSETKRGPTLDSRNIKLDCYASSLEEYLNSPDKENFDKALLSQFIKTKVVYEAKQQILQSRKAYEAANRGKGDGTDLGQIRKDAIHSLETLVSLLPKKYEGSRMDLMTLQKQLVKDEAEDIKAELSRANSLKASASVDEKMEGMQLENEVNAKKRELLAFAMNIDESNRYAKDRGLNYGVFDSALIDNYIRSFDAYKRQIETGLNQNSTTFNTDFLLVDPSTGQVVARVANGGGQNVQAINGTINTGNGVVIPNAATVNGGVITYLPQTAISPQEQAARAANRPLMNNQNMNQQQQLQLQYMPNGRVPNRN